MHAEYLSEALGTDGRTRASNVIKATSQSPGDEHKLRTKILAGSQELEDYRALADILLNSGRAEECLAVLHQALELPLPHIQRARISAETAWILWEFGKPESAIRAAQVALSHIADHPEGPEVLLIRGLGHLTLAVCTYFQDRATSERSSTLAVESFERLLSEYPDYEDLVGACLHAAGAYVQRAEYAKAVALYEEAMRRDPSDQNRLHCLTWIGSALSSDGRYAEAEKRLREALGLAEVDPRGLHRIYFEIGRVLHLTNRPTEALRSFQQALAALEGNPLLRGDRDFIADIKCEVGHILYEAERYGEAISTFAGIISELPRPNPYYYTLVTLGHSYLATGQHAKARDCYEEVLASKEAPDDNKVVAREGLSRLPPPPRRRTH